MDEMASSVPETPASSPYLWNVATLGRHTMPQTLEQSTAMAIQNLNLAARAYGLGVGMLSIIDPQAVETLFQTPATWRFSLYLCIGWPQFTDDQPLLHRNGWQENTATEWLKR